ncbi:helix-turn-helix domain-containing protein [Nocardia vinacea]|uniref:helix-turn-helix domain-containing protein n=1 Tax=Nocardia vinacea TaxID=96468 RepID=UPI0003104705|nr:helix-turn-helix transcriptional regulator [Nocardia vinacea]
MTAVRAGKAGELAQFIASRRIKMGMSRNALALRAGLNPSTVTRIEQGVFAHPTLHCLRALAEALDIAPDDLFALAGGMTTAKARPSKPDIHITYHDVPSAAAHEIYDAVDLIAKRHGLILNSSHEFTYSNHQRAA